MGAVVGVTVLDEMIPEAPFLELQMRSARSDRQTLTKKALSRIFLAGENIQSR